MTDVCGVSNGGKPAVVVHGSDSTQVLRQSLEISCVILQNLWLLIFHKHLSISLGSMHKVKKCISKLYSRPHHEDPKRGLGI